MRILIKILIILAKIQEVIMIMKVIVIMKVEVVIKRMMMMVIVMK
jgi:hypothetical protein